jgi:hypothetical protein
MPSSICARKRQKRQVVILSVDKIVPAERLAGRGTGVGADLEIRCLNQVTNRKWLQLDTSCTGSFDLMETIDIT